MTTDNKPLDPREAIALLRRQRGLLLASIGGALAVAILYLWGTPPLYRADALVMVEPQASNLLVDAQTMGGRSPAEMTARIESEAEILRSDATALALINAVGLMSDPEFGPRSTWLDRARHAVGYDPTDPPQDALLATTLERLRSAVTVRRNGMTYLLRVSVTARSPDQAATLTNALLATYIARQVQSKVDATQTAQSALEAQLSAAQTRLATSEEAVARYLDDNLTRLAAQSDDPEVAALYQRLEDAKSNHTKAQNRAYLAAKSLSEQNWAGMAEVLGQDAVTALNEDRNRFARRLDQGGAVDQDALLARLQQVENQLQSAGETGLRRLEDALLQTREQEAAARDRMRQAVVNGGVPSETLSELHSVRQDAAVAQRHHDAVLQRARELEAQAALQVADSRVVSPALPPRAPVSPNVRFVLLLALVLGGGLGGVLAWFREYILGGIQSLEQLRNITNTRRGVSIPFTKPVPPQRGPADAVLDQPMAPFAEAFRRLRADLAKAEPTGRGVAIMVTSSLPGEGKSASALALARTFTNAGKRTLVIDADLRKPTLHSMLGSEPQTGLLEYLTAQDDGRGAYDVDPRSDLGVILGHRRSDIPTDQPLQSEAFRNLIASACDRFDAVIIDTPPLLPVVDGRYVAAHCDAAVLCVQAHATGQRDLRQAWEQLSDSLPSGAPIIPVLTQEKERHSTRYYGYDDAR